MTKTTRLDIAEYLVTDEDIAAFLEEAGKGGDFDHLAEAIGKAARAIGLASLAKRAGISRKKLFATLTDDEQADIRTLMKIVHAVSPETAAAKARVKEPA